MSRRLKIAFKDHRSESVDLTNALHAAGHEFVNGPPADAFMIDLDLPGYQYGPLIERFHEAGSKLILYPHGGGAATLSYDGLFDPDPRFAANLVTAVGHAEVLRRLEYPANTYTIGWRLCEIRPFRPRADVKQVVFAPTHPNGDGSMMEHRRELNTKVFEALLKGPWNLTVRYLTTLEANGLWEADGVQFVNGRGRPLLGEIDVADAVVAGDGTFPSLAVARGVPTVVYGQHELAWGLVGEEPVPPRRLELYEAYNRFPIDFEDGPLDELVHAAARSDESIVHWRRRFIGERFDALAFAETVERIMSGPPADDVQIDPTKRVATLGFVDELLETPELLRTYAATYGPENDATLMLWAPAVPPQKLLSMAEEALAAAGLQDDRVPDILLVPLPGSPAADRALAERADALLSEWPSAGEIGKLPRFSASRTART